jgi:hypothetical protein
VFGRDGTIFHSCVSRQGVRQGSVLGPLAFSLLLNASLARLQEKHGAPVAYLDDVTVRVTAAALAKAGGTDAFIRSVVECFEGTGLELNTSKTVLFLRPDFDTGDIPTLCKVERGVTRLLGGPLYWPVGDGAVAAAAFVSAKAKDATEMFKLAEQFSNPLLQIAVARVCLAPALDFLLRVTPRHVAREAVTIFDTALRHFVLRAVGTSATSDKTAVGWELAQLPEGLGLRTAALVADSGAYESSRAGDHRAHGEANRLLEAKRERLLGQLSEEDKATVIASSAPLASLWRRPEPWRIPLDITDYPR